MRYATTMILTCIFTCKEYHIEYIKLKSIVEAYHQLCVCFRQTLKMVYAIHEFYSVT